MSIEEQKEQLKVLLEIVKTVINNDNALRDEYQIGDFRPEYAGHRSRTGIYVRKAQSEQQVAIS